MRLKLAWSAVGSLWTAGVQILVIPLYARLAPVEVYGVVLFTVAVRGTVLGLAHGFRVAFARSVAMTGRMDALSPALQRGFLAAGAALPLGLLLLAPVLATRWLRVPEGHARSTSVALAWLAGICACEWWATRWEAVLWGRQRMKALAVARVVGATSLGFGGAAVLRWHPQSAAPFSAFQALVAGMYLLTVWRLAHRGHEADRPHREAPAPSAVPGRRGELSASVVLPSVAALGLLADRTLLSGLLPIGTYAAYGAAAAAGSGLLVVAAPMVETLYPMLVAAYARGAVDEAAHLVLRGTRWILLAAIPLAAVLSVESREVLSLWLGEGRLAADGAAVLRWLAPAFALIGLASLSTAALVAGGAAWRGLAIQVAYLTTGSAALVAAVRVGGSEPAAATWALAALANCLAAGVAVTRVGPWGRPARRTLVRITGALLLAPVAAVAAVLGARELPATGTPAVLLRLAAQGTAALVATALVLILVTGWLPWLPLMGRPAAERTS